MAYTSNKTDGTVVKLGSDNEITKCTISIIDTNDSTGIKYLEIVVGKN